MSTPTNGTNGSWFSPKTVMQLGLGAVLSLFLVYQGAKYLPETYSLVQKVAADVGLIEQQHMDLKGDVNTLKQAMLEKVDKQIQLAEEGVRVQQRICIQGARTKEDARNCINP